MELAITSFKELKLNEIQGITYNGVSNGRVSFTIRDKVYTYAPDSAHSDVNEWDRQIREILGAYNQSGKALNFVKQTSSDYRIEEATTTADMDLELVNTKDFDKDKDGDEE